MALSMRGYGIMAMLAAVAIVACSNGDGVGTGADDLTQDSFAKPTEHGELRFGDSPNEAELTTTQRFHAWTFTLSKTAKLDLKSQIVTENLDSVIYLYRRDPGSDSWGSYVATNDDETGTTLASRIKGSFDAGEYRVELKAKKTQMTGRLRIAAVCSGSGCPAVDASCTAKSFTTMPDETRFGASCTGKIDAVLAAPIASTGNATTVLSKKCSLGAIERTAVDLYHEYWDDLGGWADFTGEGEGDPETSIHVTRESHGPAGTVVGVDTDADEDAMTFVFDGAGKLLFYYQSNESPTWSFFCATAGEKKSDGPDERCISDALSTADAKGIRHFVCK